MRSHGRRPRPRRTYQSAHAVNQRLPSDAKHSLARTRLRPGFYFAVFTAALVWHAWSHKNQASWLSVSATKSMHDELDSMQTDTDSEVKQEERDDLLEVELDPDTKRMLDRLDDDAVSPVS